LTDKGQMGVFDEEGGMQGMFDLGDLTDVKKEIQAEVYDLTYEMLFVPKEDEDEEERKRREQVLEEFKKHYFDFYGEEFHEETGVFFNNLDLREQGAFMQFAREASDAQTNAAMDIVKKYGEAGLQSFVAHAENTDMGNTLLEIADLLPDKMTQSVFRDYANFVNIVNDVESYIAQEFDLDNPDQLANRVANSLLQRGENILQRVSGHDAGYKQIRNEISDLSSSTIVFLHGIKELKKLDQPLHPDLLEKTQLNRTTADDVSDADFEQMQEIYRRNYPAEECGKEAQEALINKLAHIQQSDQGEFYTFSYEDEVRGFLGLEADGSVDGVAVKQAAAFNIDPEFQNYAVGHMMIENALETEAASSILIANSNPGSTLTAHYLEKGFVGTDVSVQSGSAMLDIAWDEGQNGQYRFKYSNTDEIISTFKRHADNTGVSNLDTGETIIREGSWERVDLVKHLSQKVVTRAFSQDGQWYVVFEPAPDKEYPESMK